MLMSDDAQAAGQAFSERGGGAPKGGRHFCDIFRSSVKALLAKCPSVQGQPDGLTIHTNKWFLGAGFLGAPPISLALLFREDSNGVSQRVGLLIRHFTFQGFSRSGC